MTRVDDPLAGARARGKRIMNAMLHLEGGVLKTGDVAELLGISEQSVEERRKTQSLLGIPVDSGDHVYPVWQFAARETLPGLREVLQAFSIQDPWMQLNFFLTEDSLLGSRRPLDVLREAAVPAVLQAARVFSEHLAP